MCVAHRESRGAGRGNPSHSSSVEIIGRVACAHVQPTATKFRIVWVVFEKRHASVAFEVVPSNDLHQALSWSGKTLTKLFEKQESYTDEDMHIAPDDGF